MYIIKVGDTVINTSSNTSGVVTDIEIDMVYYTSDDKEYVDHIDCVEILK